MPTAIEILRDCLRVQGYDGLYFEAECSCRIDDLAPCGENFGDCKPGVRVAGCSDDCGMGCDFHITSGKPEGEEPPE
jgi:hypothetical protein